jgi:hypothetical protein
VRAARACLAALISSTLRAAWPSRGLGQHAARPAEPGRGPAEGLEPGLRRGGGGAGARRFRTLKARAKALGWELIDKTDKNPFYLLAGKDGRGNPTTHSSVRLYPPYPDDPLSGLDSVSHMLDQIESIQKRGSRQISTQSTQENPPDSTLGGFLVARLGGTRPSRRTCNSPVSGRWLRN